MHVLCEEFRQAREEFIGIINSIPESRRNEMFLGEWSVKDILAHLTGWGLYQIEVLRDFQNGVLSERPKSVKDFNDGSVAARREHLWNEIYEEFIGTGDRLLAEYEALTDNQWEKEIWDDKDLTPEGFINIEIKHYRETHLPQIKRWLSS